MLHLFPGYISFFHNPKMLVKSLFKIEVIRTLEMPIGQLDLFHPVHRLKVHTVNGDNGIRYASWNDLVVRYLQVIPDLIRNPGLLRALIVSTFAYHCQESIRLFGKPYAEVHRWLDEFAGSKEYGYRHRKLRHHEEGIRQAMELFGKGAGEAARYHILSDLKEEGWTEQDHFPRDEADYLRMGLF